MKRYLLIGILFGMILLAGCGQQAQTQEQQGGGQGQMVGNDRDEHGCIPSAGYSWCEEKQKCYRPWEENCASSGGSAIETKAREFCGKENIEKVYVCGEYIRTVATLIGGGSTIYDANGNKLSECPMVNPEYFDATCKRVLMENYCEDKEIC